jgi:hypothetical protein
MRRTPEGALVAGCGVTRLPASASTRCRQADSEPFRTIQASFMTAHGVSAMLLLRAALTLRLMVNIRTNVTRRMAIAFR